ncbi:SGNH/GDSL hydrolase family protein [Pseudarthrobacter sp. BIM B-2242]|uniref:SGNH/GDSL hydrolase family protein n=1 Tax=Pseudarthrobacter sp. BIM B-2242 TaxID=2772401 RepID=UPI00168B2011|nr:SGNH/GDSL hydrolase family protein [Pseudarthrobacter sp. BIM B-2242]QOD04874.1 hypothetical protein IDT60_07630 [Pseudarthrobacter sp. BIM B-2242]
MPDYPFEGQLLADPVSFQRAVSAQITVYDANDATNSTPLALKDASGVPTANPLTSSSDAFVKPIYAPSPDIKYVGAGLSVFVSSTQGMRDAAEAAAAAAQDAANTAVVAVADRIATAAVDGAGALVLTKANGTTVNAGNVRGAKGDKGDPGAKGLDGANVLPTAEAIAQAVTTDGPAKTALSVTILDLTSDLGGGASVLQGFVADMATGVDDLSLLIVGDSTTVENTPAPSWARRIPAKLAALYPHLNISTRILASTLPSSTFDAATVITGTGTRTLHVWIFARAGETWQFFTDAVRRSVGFGGTVNANAIIINNGHNDNASGVSVGTEAILKQVRDKAVAHVEQIKALNPGVPVAMIAQNPNTTFPNSSERRATMYRRMATERGMEFINVCQAFYDDGRPMAELVRDGTHPSDAGYEIWADKVMEHLTPQANAQPVTILPSSYNTLARNLLADPMFAAWDGTTTPAGWTVTNVTLSKDTVNYETGTWGMKMTKTADGAAAWVQIPLPHAFIAGQKGMFAARVRVPAGVTTNAAQVALLASGQALDGSAIWDTKDQFMWRIIHKLFPDGITSASARIYVDPSTAAGAASVTVDRMSFVLGTYPSEPV